jgi:hypothetical protein
MSALSRNARLASAVCGLALLTAAQTAPARAQPTIVQGHYEETMGPGQCNNMSGTECSHQFTAVPSNETLIVTAVNCRIMTRTKNAQIESVTLAVNTPQQFPILYLPVTPTGNFTSNAGLTTAYTATATPISKIYTAGQAPSVLLIQFAPNNPWFLCTIEGTITP